jgi:hypothetical protein
MQERLQMNANLGINELRPLSAEETNAVSGGFWGAVAGAALGYLGGKLVDGVLNVDDPKEQKQIVEKVKKVISM